MPEALARWPLTLSADGLTLTYGFDTQKDDTGIAELLAALATQGIAYKDLRTSESSLEDIFVSLVHEQKAGAFEMGLNLHAVQAPSTASR